ncbi:MAG: DUF368 domain-containing protein [Lachnospiraceae bacterium]|nr:DUF368 domain-containing protein [Lachnospiraceae bacterium]
MSKKITTHITTAAKGLVIGGTMLVPGVSGGSMAMILGIYKRLVSSISSFFKDVKNNIVFLGIFVVGALAGMAIFAKPLLALIEAFPKPMLYFFMGAVAGGIPMMYRESKVKRISVLHILYVLIGIAIVILLGLLPTDFLNSEGMPGAVQFLIQLAAGAVAAIALILPGISVSYMLLVLGIYEPTVAAIGNLDILYLLPLGIGVVLGILLTTKLLETFMNKYPSVTYLVILGFILGSLKETFPGIPSGVEWLICIGTIVLGFMAIYSLSKFESSYESK